MVQGSGGTEWSTSWLCPLGQLLALVFMTSLSFSSSGQELVYSWGLSQEISFKMDFSGGSVGKESTNNAGEAGDTCSIPGLGRSPGGGNGYPLQDSCLGDPRDREAWWASVHGITKSQTWLKWLSMHPFYYCCFLFFNFYLYSFFQLFFSFGSSFCSYFLDWALNLFF